MPLKTPALLTQFHATIRVSFDVGMCFSAENFEQALELAKKFKPLDCADLKGDYLDGSGPELISIWKDDE